MSIHSKNSAKGFNIKQMQDLTETKGDKKNRIRKVQVRKRFPNRGKKETGFVMFGQIGRKERTEQMYLALPYPTTF